MPVKTKSNDNENKDVKETINKGNVVKQQPNINNDVKNQENKEYKKIIEEKDKKIKELSEQLEALNSNFKTELEKRARIAQEQLDKKVAEISSKYAAEATENKKYAIKNNAEELIDIINQINNVIASSENNENPAVRNYVVGFKLYMSMFDNLLMNMGIKEIPIKIGDAFDHNKMEAIDTEKSDIKSNHVSKIVKKGYTLHDRVIVYAQVIVSK